MSRIKSRFMRDNGKMRTMSEVMDEEARMNNIQDVLKQDPDYEKWLDSLTKPETKHENR